MKKGTVESENSGQKPRHRYFVNLHCSITPNKATEYTAAISYMGCSSALLHRPSKSRTAESYVCVDNFENLMGGTLWLAPHSCGHHFTIYQFDNRSVSLCLSLVSAQKQSRSCWTISTGSWYNLRLTPYAVSSQLQGSNIIYRIPT